MIAGKFDPFTGPMKAQNGTVEVPEGKVITTDQLWSMKYLVDNVQGSIK